MPHTFCAQHHSASSSPWPVIPAGIHDRASSAHPCRCDTLVNATAHAHRYAERGFVPMNDKPKQEPKPRPEASQPREVGRPATARQALQQSMDRHW
jgi:hypothetical protein